MSGYKTYLKIAQISLILCLLVGFNAQAKTLKIATLAPAGTTWMKEMKNGAKIIKEKTDGRVKLKFYPGGVMGNDKSVHRKIKIGQLHGGAFTSGGLAHINTAIQAYSLPMLFQTYEEATYVREKMDTTVKQAMADSGFVILGMAGGGFARILSRHSLTNLEAIRAAKVWIPEGDQLVQETFNTLGISPISLPISDVFTGLQTGLIETVTVNPTSAIAFQWHTSTQYMTETPVLYLLGILAIQKKSFDKLKPEDQAVVIDEMSKVYDKLEIKNREDNIKAQSALVSQGIKTVKPDEQEQQRWHQLSQQAIQSMTRQGLIEQSIVDQVLQHLADFRQ